MTELILYYISRSFILQRQKNLKWGKLKLVNVVVRSLFFTKSSLLSMLFLYHIFIHTLFTLTSFLPFLVFWNCGDTYLWSFLFFLLFSPKQQTFFQMGLLPKLLKEGTSLFPLMVKGLTLLLHQHICQHFSTQGLVSQICFFCQITTFIKIHEAFVFGLQTL